jgi:flagellar biosynthesis/type III secretory pathway protein FliH
LYNPLPAGKSAKLASPRGAPVWQPLKPLKPIELQNAGFVQENYLQPKSSHFALWTVEEQLEAGKMADAAEERANADGTDNGDTDASGSVGEEGSTNSDNDSSASLSGLDAEAIEKIKNEAYERGVADGKKQQQETIAEEAEQAEAESLTSLADKANQLLVNIEQGVVALQENPAEWNEPLKRLALHLAEQLTLTELSISSSGIQNLIDRCIETLDVQTASSVVVELNPSDMTLLQNHKAAPGEQTHQWRLVADPHLLPGSVRVRADDAVVSDLIEHRLENLAQSLLKDTKPWQAQTAFQPERLAARRGKAETVEDALPRNTNSRFAQAKEEADLVDTEFDDVVDTSASPQPATAEPLNLSALDLPDLNLSDAKPLSEDDETGASNV